jgi:hypothetical protein
MNRNFFIPLGVITFAVMLVIILRDSLTGEAAQVAVGIGIGLIVGVPVGMASMGLAVRASRYTQPPASPPAVGLTLTPEQTELLIKAIERQQANPAGFGLAARQTRTITSVGGADVSDLVNPQDQN